MASGTTNLWERIRSYLTVTIITVLIWLYAESENVKLQDPLTFNVQFVEPPGQHLAIAPVNPLPVKITVRCAAGQYTRLRQLQRRVLRLTAEEDPALPTRVISLQTWLEHQSDIGQLGVSFVEVQPSTLELRVERLEEVTLPISSDRVVPDSIRLTGVPILNPGQATVRLPIGMTNNLEHQSLEAILAPEVVARLEQNVQHDLTVPITLPESIRRELWVPLSAIHPPTTEVTLTIRKQTDNYTASSVPILLVAPWRAMERVSITLPDGQRVLSEDVDMTGPSDVIERIRQGELKVWAELRLTVEDLEQGITSKQVHINLPRDVQIDSTPPTISFTITPREAKPTLPIP